MARAVHFPGCCEGRRSCCQWASRAVLPRPAIPRSTRWLGRIPPVLGSGAEGGACFGPSPAQRRFTGRTGDSQSAIAESPQSLRLYSRGVTASPGGLSKSGICYEDWSPPADHEGAAYPGEMTMLALPLARRPSSCGSCPSECPSRAVKSSPVLDSNYVSDLGGAKRARTADLLHAMGNADVQYRQMLAIDDPCGSMPHGPRPERRSDHGQKDLETMRDHMITSRSAPRTLMYKVAVISGLRCPEAASSAMRRSAGMRALLSPGASRARCAAASAYQRGAPRLWNADFRR